MLLSDNMSLNPGPVLQDTSQCPSEWNVYRSRGFHLVHFNIKNLITTIKELCYFATEISLDNYKTMRCGKNRHRGSEACYLRNDLSI